MNTLLISLMLAVLSALSAVSGTASSASSAPSMILYSRLRSSLVCLTAPEVDAMQTQLSLRMERIMDQYLALWRMEGRRDDDMTALYQAKHAELLTRTNQRRDEIAAKQCKDASTPASPRASLRPSSAASPSVSDASDSDDDSDDVDDSPRYDASIHPYTPPYAPTVPAIFTGLTEQDIRDRHRQPPPPPQTDATAVEDDDGDDDDAHDGDVGEVIGSITPMSLETSDSETDDRHFVASIAPQRAYHEDDDDNSSFAAERRNVPRSSRARLEAIQHAARAAER